MKKLMYLCLMLAVMPFVSCSSDDDNGSPDPVIGKWQLIKISETNNGEETDFTLTDCEKQNSYEFATDGMSVSEYYYDDSDGNCQIDGTENVKWENKGSSAYILTHIEDDNYQEEGVLEGNTLTLTQTEQLSTGEYIYKEVYTRVK